MTSIPKSQIGKTVDQILDDALPNEPLMAWIGKKGLWHRKGRTYW